MKEETKKLKRVLVNNLNDLTAKEWLPETISVFTQRGLGAGHKDARIEKLHPAPYSFQDVARLIRFFTKKGDTVLDPFLGVGSTLKAAAVEGRHGIGIELVEKFYELSLERMATEVGDASDQRIIHGDALVEIKKLHKDSVDFIVTSPPYWSILSKRPDHKTKERAANNLDLKYSELKEDLGNINVYDDFIKVLSKLFIDCSRVLKHKKYMCIVVSDFRHKDKFYLFHSDLARAIEKSGKFSLKGVTVLYQRHKKIFPYGYPYSYVPNIHHQYIIILQNQKEAIAKEERNIYEGDVVKLLKKVDDSSVDLIIADPPYGMKKDHDFGVGIKWTLKDQKEYLEWSEKWLSESYRVLKNGGSIFVYGIHNNIGFIQQLMYELGFEYGRMFIWHYKNGFSGFKNRPAATYEPLLWFYKGKGYTYHQIREPYLSTERLKHKVIKNGKVWTPNPLGRHAGDIWEVPTLAGKRFEKEKHPHPTQKPLAICKKIINHFSNPGDLVLVPFAGSGSECVSALDNDRDYIGIELNKDYVAMSQKRLDDHKNTSKNIRLL